jgi:hypothetical protein
MSRPSLEIRLVPTVTIQLAEILAPISQRTVKPLNNAIRRASSLSDSIPTSFDANYITMSLRERTRPGLGIIEPCLPSPADIIVRKADSLR